MTQKYQHVSLVSDRCSLAEDSSTCRNVGSSDTRVDGYHLFKLPISPKLLPFFSIALDKSLSTIKKALTSTLGNGHFRATGSVQTCASTTVPLAQNYRDIETIVLLVARGRSDSGGRNYAPAPHVFQLQQCNNCHLQGMRDPKWAHGQH